MKRSIIISFFLLVVVLQLAAQQAGYTRDGAQATIKQTSILFKDPFLFKKGRLNLSGDKAELKSEVLAALQVSDQVIKEYEEKVDAFIKSKPTAIIVKEAYADVTNQVKVLPSVLARAEDGFKNWRSIGTVSFMQDLYLYKAFIASAMKVYPEALSLEEKLAEVDAAIAKYGSREAFITKMERNQAEYIKNLRMKKAVFADPGIEASIKKQYESIWEAEKLVVTKVHITTIWVIEKNVLDIPLHKEVEVNLAIKKANGTCAIASGYARSTYEVGGKYSAPLLIMPTPPIVIPCENL